MNLKNKLEKYSDDLKDDFEDYLDNMMKLDLEFYEELKPLFEKYQ